jgi:mannose-6-phosphate isomerase-like protein (cupin superfamily)
MRSKPTAIFVPPLKPTAQGGTTVRITSRQMDGAYCVCEMTTMPGEGVSLHVHDRDEEFYYILEGAYERVRDTLGGADFRLDCRAGVLASGRKPWRHARHVKRPVSESSMPS